MSKFATFPKVSEFWKSMHQQAIENEQGQLVFTGYTTTEIWVEEMGYTKNDPSYSHTITTLKVCDFAEQTVSGVKGLSF